MNFRTVLTFAVLAAGCAAPSVAQEPTPPAAGQQQLVPLSQAVATAEQGLGARAFDVELDSENGVLVYEIELAKEGRELDARVDAVTGRMLPAPAKSRLRIPTRLCENGKAA